MESKYLKSLTTIITKVVSSQDLAKFTEGKNIISTTPITATNDYAVVYKFHKSVKYEDIVANMVEEKYPSQSDREGILRKGIVNPSNEEFVAFHNYIEECKVAARAFVAERDGN